MAFAFLLQARIAKLMRKSTPVVAASRVLNAIQRLQDNLKDDTTIVVVDVEPPGFDRSQVGSIYSATRSEIPTLP